VKKSRTGTSRLKRVFLSRRREEGRTERVYNQKGEEKAETDGKQERKKAGRRVHVPERQTNQRGVTASGNKFHLRGKKSASELPSKECRKRKGVKK